MKSVANRIKCDDAKATSIAFARVLSCRPCPSGSSLCPPHERRDVI